MILCCGEALIDMLPRQTTDGGNSFAPHAGGAVFNTAITLGRLKVPSGFFCGLSNDLFGEQLAKELTASGVDASFSPRVDRPCTLAFVELVNGQARYAFYDENTALRAMTADELPELDNDISTLFFGGISLASDPAASAFEAMMNAHAETHLTMIDPNIRPGFIKDEASYRARIGRMMDQADIVKLSDEDLAWVHGEGGMDQGVEVQIARGTKLMLITEGSKGATAFTKDKKVFVPANKVHVVDTVGAGDTFNGGFLAGLSDLGALSKSRLTNLTEDELTQALSLGTRAAAVTVSRAGANPPTREEL